MMSVKVKVLDPLAIIRGKFYLSRTPFSKPGLFYSSNSLGSELISPKTLVDVWLLCLTVFTCK